MPEAYHWLGTSTELLSKLDALVPESTRKQAGWPKSPRGLTNTISRLTPNLRAADVDVVSGLRQPRTGQRQIGVLILGLAEPPSDCNGLGKPHSDGKPVSKRCDLCVTGVTGVTGANFEMDFDGAGDTSEGTGDTYGSGRNGDVSPESEFKTAAGDAGDAGDTKIQTFDVEDL